jgi:Flp pilus assembly protein TadG
MADDNMPGPARRFAVRRSRWNRARPVAERGSSTLEFVILLPFLMMVMVGIIDSSLVMYDKAALVAAARAAARAGTVVSVPALTTAQIAAVASANATASLVNGGASSTPSVTVTHASGTSTGNPLTVQISYTYRGLLLGSALSALTGPVVLNVTAVMNYE